MVPPGDIGPIPIWVGVYLALLVTCAISAYVLDRRVFHLVRQGRSVARFDRPWERLKGAMIIVLGQRRVLQRVPQRDWAGIGHALIFWGFLSFSLSYLIFIFVASVWRPFPEVPANGDGGPGLQRLLGYPGISASCSLGLGFGPSLDSEASPLKFRFDA